MKKSHIWWEHLLLGLIIGLLTGGTMAVLVLFADSFSYGGTMCEVVKDDYAIQMSYAECQDGTKLGMDQSVPNPKWEVVK